MPKLDKPWKKELPTEPGLYLTRYRKLFSVVHVVHNEDDVLVDHDGDDLGLYNKESEWAGPIELEP